MHTAGTNNPKFDQRVAERLEQALVSIKASFTKNLIEVFVFGSYAKGNARKFSSIDVLVVIKESHDRFTQRNANLHRLLNEYDLLPMIDPLVYTESELLDLIEKKESFIDSILGESFVVWSDDRHIFINQISDENRVVSRYEKDAPKLSEDFDV